MKRIEKTRTLADVDCKFLEERRGGSYEGCKKQGTEFKI